MIVTDSVRPCVKQLFQASALGDFETLQRLVLIYRVNVNAEWKGQTPLSSAVRAGQTEAVRFLLEHGASRVVHVLNLDDRNDSRVLYRPDWRSNSASSWTTPMHLAAASGHVEICQLLLGSEAEASRFNLSDLLWMKNQNGSTPMDLVRDFTLETILKRRLSRHDPAYGDVPPFCEEGTRKRIPQSIPIIETLD